MEELADNNGEKTIIQCHKEDRMKEIFNKFLLKTQIDKNSIYYLYAGNTNINEELSFEEVATQEDKNRNKMIIIVNENNNIDTKISSLEKSKDVICPICKEDIKLNFEEYKIKLYDCKNKHEDNIYLNEFEETQKIDFSKIICGLCNSNKNETFHNQFYRCNTCKINICPLCKSNHDKKHNIIDYDSKNYICENHNGIYNLYCKDCNKDLCMHCENEHNNHEIISFGKVIPNIDNIKNEMKELKEKLDKLKSDIKEMINILTKTTENLEFYYNISNEIINNYDNKKINFAKLNNINNIFNNNIIKDINYIIGENNIKNKFIKIYDIHDEMIKKDINNLKKIL